LIRKQKKKEDGRVVELVEKKERRCNSAIKAAERCGATLAQKAPHKEILPHPVVA
jgi:tRNA/tmRNA/rRNA uracil-C5-methylase (TrmA/RlmC/RlmD family)